MPITGQESALASAINSAISAAIAAQAGGAPQNPNYISALSTGIANAIIPFLVSNTLVEVPGAGLIDSANGPVTGEAMGTIS